jgi:hypothetical protein
MNQVMERAKRLRAGAAGLALLLMIAAVAVGPLDRSAHAASESQAHAGKPRHHFVTQGLYLSTAVYHRQAWSWYQPTRFDSWIATDGSGMQKSASGKPWFASQEDRETWEAVGKPKFLAQGFRPHVGVQTLPPNSFNDLLYSAQLASEVPSDPAAAGNWLRDLADQPTRGGGNGFEDSVKTIEFLTELLRNPALSAAQRSALYESETSIPGVEVIGPAEDVLGRAGIAIAAESANSGALTRYSLVVDPKNARILESEALRLQALPHEDEWAGPQISSRETYLQEGAASSSRSKKRSAGRKHAHRR